MELKDTSIANYCIENAEMPATQAELVQLLKEAQQQGADFANNGNRLEKEAAVKEALRKQQINLDYIMKTRLRKTSGVYRLPDEAIELWNQLKRP